MTFFKAAHCIRHSKYINVTLVKVGMLKRLQDDEFTSTYSIVEIFEHPEYKRQTINNDIALLRLNDTIDFNEKIYPICLPTKQHEDPEVIVTGFGKTGFNHQQSDNLLKVGLQWFTFAECQKLYRTKKLDESSMICYGHQSERKDACEVS